MTEKPNSKCDCLYCADEFDRNDGYNSDFCSRMCYEGWNDLEPSQ